MSALSIDWPSTDFSRVPYAVFVDPEIYAREQERIFKGPYWCYLALEAEIPKPGDYVVVYVGDAPVVVARGRDGKVNAFVNRCAHRGSTVVRALQGHADDFTCVYHHWRYDLEGHLLSVPFQRGIAGQGGMPPSFDRKCHNLPILRVETYRGLAFGTFHADAPPLTAYLGPKMIEGIDRIFRKPIEILGYQRQRMPSNWKLYWENINDPYHAGLLHQMATTFGLTRITQGGAVILDEHKRHIRNYYYYEKGAREVAAAAYAQTKVFHDNLKLEDTSIVSPIDEFGDGILLDMIAIFPCLFIQQRGNGLLTRQIRPKSPDEFELYWTYFAYADDTPELRQRRLQQANMSGPGGLVAMEDGESGVLVQRAIKRQMEHHSVLEMGGVGPIEDHHHLCTEVSLRGFWLNYHAAMQFGAG